MVISQAALAHFLRVDDDLLDVTALSSPPIEAVADAPGALEAWIQKLPAPEKNQFLLRVMQGTAAGVGTELNRQFRGASASGILAPPRRTVTELFEAAEQRRHEQARLAAADRAEAAARPELKRAKARAQRLASIAEEGDGAWSRVDALIATRKPLEYDAAIPLVTDLKALAERDDTMTEYATRVAAIRNTHARKVSLIERFDKAGIK